MKKKNTHKKEKIQRRATAAARQLGIWETAVAASRSLDSPAIYLSSCCQICVLMLPHTAIYVFSCCQMCPHTAIYVTSYCQICVIILLYMCPHAARYVSSYC